MNEYITGELIKNTYLFCVKRISDTEAAKDLSQDILYEAMRVIEGGKKFVSFYSWYWRMARNKYADYIAHKQNAALPLEAAMGMAADVTHPIAQLISAEEISQLNYALSRLASIHREIMIRFYLKEQSAAQIAEELQIPLGTVKRRLFDARKTLKERFDLMNNIGKTAYAPAEVDLFWGYAAMRASQLMSSSKICPQVMVICRNAAKSVNEIADEMGIAPVYLEEYLEQMVQINLLISPAKGKYQANTCVIPQQVYASARVYANEIFHAREFPQRITEKLLMLKDHITSVEFYGNDFDYGYLLWILYVMAGFSIGDHGKSHYLAKYKGRLPDEAERSYRLTMQYTLADETFDNSVFDRLKEKDWSCLHQNFTTSEHGYLEYVNFFEREPFPDDEPDELNWRRGRDRWVDGNNIGLLLDLAKDPQKKLTIHEEAKAAEFLKNGLLRKENSALIVQLPIFTREAYNMIYEMVAAEMKDLAAEFADAVSDGVERLLLPYVRRDLRSNFIHWDMQNFLQPICGLFYYGWDKHLAQPEDYSTSAAGLYIPTE